jgi:hypothetical protein
MLNGQNIYAISDNIGLLSSPENSDIIQNKIPAVTINVDKIINMVYAIIYS